MIKTQKEIGIEEIFFNLINSLYKKPRANIIFNGQRLKAFPLTPRTGENISFHYSYSICCLCNRQKTEREREQKEKEKE